MSKYRALFIEEGREHLAELSRLLVAGEGAGDNTALIDELFRRIHSVKGMAASMGYDPISALAHRMEDLVDIPRKRKTTLAGPVIDLLLKGIDALSQQVEDIAAQRTLGEHIELVHAVRRMVEAQQASSPAAPAQSASASAPETASAAPAVATAPTAPAGPTQIVRVSLVAECASPSVRAFMVYRKVAEHGTVVEAIPPLEVIRRQEVKELNLTFAVATSASAETLQRAVGDIADVGAVDVELRAPSPAEPAAVDKAVVQPDPVADARVASTVRVRTDLLDHLIDSVGELFIVRARLRSLLEGQGPEVRAVLDVLDRHIRDVHGQVMSVRMLPVSVLTDRYPRLVRDLSRSLGKDVQLVVEGGSNKLDRAILDNLDAPFVHTLRNAIDHGIESPDQRVERGKPRAGKVTIASTRDRDTVVVVIEDDGRGLDADALRSAAVEKGLVTREQAAALSQRDAHFLICLPGFSTKEEVSDVSGRGVGMDAVRSKIESLGGTLDIHSEVGKGTRFSFRLPLTLAIINVLLVETGGRVFAVPVAKLVAVREALDTITEVGGARYLPFRDAAAPVLDLHRLLGLPRARAAEQIVVIEDGHSLVALAVERVMGYQEVVVKPLGDPLERLEWFAGATILGDGQPILILDLSRALREGLAA